MVMTVSDDESQCHPKAQFWLPWENFSRLDAFCRMNGMQQVATKKVFGLLLASRIIHLRRVQPLKP